MKFENTNIQQFVDDLIKTTTYHHVNLNLSDTRSIELIGGGHCNGYFEDNGTRRELAVAIGQPFEQWLPILVHESCHMDQWIEQCDAWQNAFTDSYEAMDILTLWMNGHVELNDDQLDKYITAAQLIELDCERRTVEKIKKYNLPIDVSRYTKQANAYVWFYMMIGKHKMWYTIGNEPYNVESVVSLMPDVFLEDAEYKKMPVNIRVAFIKDVLCLM